MKMNHVRKYGAFYAILAAVALWIYLGSRPPETIEVIRTIEVEVPVIEKVFDTVTEVVPVRVTEPDPVLVEEFEKLKDEAERLQAFKDAVTEREYTETFEDSIQTINVFSRVRGNLLAQTVDYKTKPRSITVTDTFHVQQRGFVSGGMELGFPLEFNPDRSGAPILRGTLTYTNKKRNSLTIGLDTDKRLWIGKTFKLF